MAHIVFTSDRARIDLNLDPHQEAAVREFLFGLIAAPVSDLLGPFTEAEAVAVLEREAAQVSEPPAPTPRLPARTCQGPDCTTVFHPKNDDHIYCTRPCKTAATNAKTTAKTAGAFPCKEPGCKQSFPTAAGSHTRDRRTGATKAKLNGTTVDRPATPIPVVTTVLGGMEFTCPHDDCGRVYDDENRLIHHRRVIHDLDRVEPIHEVIVSTPAMAVRVG